MPDQSPSNQSPAGQSPAGQSPTGQSLPERPRLAPGVRLHHDRTRNAWVLLSPERVIVAEGPASEILRRCDGKHTVAEIIGELAAVYAADRELIEQDVREMMADMATRHLLA